MAPHNVLHFDLLWMLEMTQVSWIVESTACSLALYILLNLQELVHSKRKGLHFLDLVDFSFLSLGNGQLPGIWGDASPPVSLAGISADDFLLSRLACSTSVTFPPPRGPQIDPPQGLNLRLRGEEFSLFFSPRGRSCYLHYVTLLFFRVLFISFSS